MTLDEKLNNFYDSAIHDANTKSSGILSEYKDSLNTIFEEHKKDATRKAALTIRLENENFIREKNKALSTETLMIRRKVNERVGIKVDRLFDSVAKKLDDFQKTTEYTDLLIKQIKEAKAFARDEEINIYIDPSDENKKAELELSTGTTLLVSLYSFIGGTRAVIHSKNILIDNSFSTKIDEVKSHFRLDSHLKSHMKKQLRNSIKNHIITSK